MKDVLISIRPQWVEKIANGEKTIEIRKTKPKLEPPFKCYIYMTAGHASYPVEINGAPYICHNNGGMDVIGEFVCDRIVDYHPYGLRGFDLSKETLIQMCLSNKDLNEYGKLDRVYGWHISDLKIYDNSKKLSDFGQKCKYAKYQDDEMYGGWFCGNEYIECDWQDCPSCGGESCGYEDYAYCMCNGLKPLTRPPQSWCYVEGQE